MSSLVVDPAGLINGRYTYTDLGNQWFTNAFSVAVDRNPLIYDDNLDPRGRRGSVERSTSIQSNNGVFFLAGAYSSGATPPAIARSVVAPKDVPLFFPLVNQLGDNTTNDLTTFGGFALTEQQLHEIPAEYFPYGDLTLASLVDGIVGEIKGLFANLNGVPLVTDFTPFRQLTQAAPWEQLPRYFAPEDNILKVDGRTLNADLILAEPFLKAQFGDYPTLGEQRSWANSSGPPWEVPFVQGGYYLTIRSPGTGILNFGGTIPGEDGPIEQNITYNLLNPMIAGNGKDTRLVGTAGQDYISGGNGKDALVGLADNDLLLGGNGADTLNGSTGDDELWGDQGADLFLFSRYGGRDKIYDFARNERVKLEGFASLDYDISNITLASGVHSALIDFGNGDTLTFVGIAKKQLQIESNLITLKNCP